MNLKWHQKWYIRIIFLVASLAIGFIIGFYKGERVYDYSIKPFVNTSGMFDLSIFWSAVAGLGTFIISGIAIWLNDRIYKLNRKSKKEKHKDDLNLWKKKLLNDINSNIKDIDFSVNLSAIKYEADKEKESDREKFKNDHINKYLKGKRKPILKEQAEGLHLSTKICFNINQNLKTDIIFNSDEILFKILTDEQINMYDYVFLCFKKINAHNDNLNRVHYKKLEFGSDTPQDINFKREEEKIKLDLSYNIMIAYGLIDEMNNLVAVIRDTDVESLVEN